MKKLIQYSIILSSIILINSQAFAQTTFQDNNSNNNNNKSAQSLLGNGSNSEENVIIKGDVSLGTGYAKNPDTLFGSTVDSPYGIAIGKILYGLTNKDGATTFAAAGKLIGFDDDIINPERWDISFAVDNNYGISDRVRVGFGAYYDMNHINLLPSDSLGGYSSLEYNDTNMIAGLVGKIDDIEYKGDNPLIKSNLQRFNKPGQYSYRRTEIVSRFLVGKQNQIGYYAEAGAANMDYTDQIDENILDRDANEMWGLAGIRWKPDSTLLFDIGYRINQRDFEDSNKHSFYSGYFDGKMVWIPQDNFSLTLSVDRKIVGPSETASLATDQIAYGLNLIYQPIDKLTLSAYAHYKTLDQVNTTSEYEEKLVGISSNYSLTEKLSLNANLTLKRFEEKTTNSEADTIDASAGINLKF